MISKSLLIALPMLALGACSSTGETESASVSTEASSVQATETAVDNTVQTDVIEEVALTEEQLLVKTYTDAILETTINFDFDKSMIKPEHMIILDAHAKYLTDNPEKALTIEGHTDEKGTPEYNIALGERRAASVATYLENMGVGESQISIVSYGEEKPANFGHDAAAWSDNRRAELTY